MTHHPTWKQFLCGCERSFTAVNEILNNTPSAVGAARRDVKKEEFSFFYAVIQILLVLMGAFMVFYVLTSGNSKQYLLYQFAHFEITVLAKTAPQRVILVHSVLCNLFSHPRHSL